MRKVIDVDSRVNTGAWSKGEIICEEDHTKYVDSNDYYLKDDNAYEIFPVESYPVSLDAGEETFLMQGCQFILRFAHGKPINFWFRGPLRAESSAEIREPSAAGTRNRSI